MEYFHTLIFTYKYLIIFPLSIIEGPVLTVVCGFFVVKGILSPIFVYPIVVVGDVIGDTAIYCLGRYGGGKMVRKFGSYLGINEDTVNNAQSFFRKHHNKTIVLSKLIHGIGFSGLFVAGILKINYRRFIKICATTTLLQSAVLLGLGILFGEAYSKLIGYLNYYADTTIIITFAIIATFLLKKVLTNKLTI